MPILATIKKVHICKGEANQLGYGPAAKTLRLNCFPE